MLGGKKAWRHRLRCSASTIHHQRSNPQPPQPHNLNPPPLFAPQQRGAAEAAAAADSDEQQHPPSKPAPRKGRGTAAKDATPSASASAASGKKAKPGAAPAGGGGKPGGGKPGGGKPDYYLMKSEPDTFSIDDLDARPGKTEPWDGVRNFVARNHMRAMRVGDRALFYHSSCKVPGVVGIVEVRWG